jgi:hypothetical protein
VIGHNFCPFAKAALDAGRVYFAVSHASTLEPALQALIDECLRLDHDATIETTLVIYPDAFAAFDDFLDLIELANRLLDMQGYEGTYQLAHFHPDYCFEGSDSNDPANYTNRSPWPTLHIIREASLEKAVANHPNPEDIPQRNIRVAQQLGIDTLKAELERCRKG